MRRTDQFFPQPPSLITRRYLRPATSILQAGSITGHTPLLGFLSWLSPWFTVALSRVVFVFARRWGAEPHSDDTISSDDQEIMLKEID